VPRVRKNPRRGRRGRGGLTLFQRAYLLTGQAYDFLRGERDPDGTPFASPAAVSTAWRTHRGELEAECGEIVKPWAHFACDFPHDGWEQATETASDCCYLDGFEGHQWHSEYAKAAETHHEWPEIKGKIGFDSRWVRTWNDVEAVKKGGFFDKARAFFAAGFFRLLRHTVGEWAGRMFRPEAWQAFDVIMPLFGWVRENLTRRFRKGHIEIPKKNGKSMICSGISLLLMLGMGEASAEVYNAAGEKEQAVIVFSEAEKLAKASPYLDGVVRWVTSAKRGYHAESGSLYRALSAEHKNKDGYKTYGLIVDELHMQQDRKLWDVLIYGGRARREPLFLAITTAGEYDPHSIGWEQHTYACRVLEGDGGIGLDVAFFAYIRCVPAELQERWMEPELWYRANPMLGITINFDDFAAEAQEAFNSPSKRASFMRYSLNIWVQVQEAAFKIERWNACCIPGKGMERVATIEQLMEGRRCFGGLDLAAVNDACAAALWFPPEDYQAPEEQLTVDSGQLTAEEETPQTGMSVTLSLEDCHFLLTYFWLPRGNIQDLERQHNAPYGLWSEEGWLRLTPGEVADYKQIRKDLVELNERWKPERWNYDKWSAAQLVTDLREADGVNMVEFGQGFGWMNAPTKEFERLMIQGRIRHAGHPMMDWMIGNCQFAVDAEGRVKLIKAGKKNIKYKIDGPIAGVQSLDGAIRCAAAPMLTAGSLIVV